MNGFGHAAAEAAASSLESVSSSDYRGNRPKRFLAAVDPSGPVPEYSTAPSSPIAADLRRGIAPPDTSPCVCAPAPEIKDRSQSYGDAAQTTRKPLRLELTKAPPRAATDDFLRNRGNAMTPATRSARQSSLWFRSSVQRTCSGSLPHIATHLFDAKGRSALCVHAHSRSLL